MALYCRQACAAASGAGVLCVHGSLGSILGLAEPSCSLLPAPHLLQEAPDVGTYAEANGTCVSCKTAHCKECTNVNATNPTSTCVRCEMGM